MCRAWKELVDDRGGVEWRKVSAAYLSPVDHASLPADGPNMSAAVHQALRWDLLESCPTKCILLASTARQQKLTSALLVTIELSAAAKAVVMQM